MEKKAIIDAVGTAGVIASLIFVGVQVQQGAAATRSTTVLQLKAPWVELNLVSATSMELTEAFETIDAEGWEADSRARSLVGGFFRALLHNWSNAYYQYQNGTLEEDQWRPHLREMEANAKNPILVAVWSDWNYVFDDQFQALMDEVLAEKAR